MKVSHIQAVAGLVPGPFLIVWVTDNASHQSIRNVEITVDLLNKTIWRERSPFLQIEHISKKALVLILKQPRL